MAWCAEVVSEGRKSGPPSLGMNIYIVRGIFDRLCMVVILSDWLEALQSFRNASTETLTHREWCLGDGLKLCKAFVTLRRRRWPTRDYALGGLKLCKAEEFQFEEYGVLNDVTAVACFQEDSWMWHLFLKKFVAANYSKWLLELEQMHLGIVWELQLDPRHWSNLKFCFNGLDLRCD